MNANPKTKMDKESIAANTLFDFGGVLALPASLTKGPVQVVFIVGMEVCTVAYGTLVLVEDLAK